MLCLGFSCRNALENYLNIKLDPWSPWMALGIPKMDLKLTRAFNTDMALMDLSGYTAGQSVD